MARRRLNVRGIDPWSVLKFGFVANIVGLAIFLLVMALVWFVIDRLELVDQVCGIATDVGFTQCGFSAGAVFRVSLLLGALWAVVQTALWVLLAFLHNLIADLTGGLRFVVVDDTPVGPKGPAAAAFVESRSAGSASATSIDPTSSDSRRRSVAGDSANDDVTETGVDRPRTSRPPRPRRDAESSWPRADRGDGGGEPVARPGGDA